MNQKIEHFLTNPWLVIPASFMVIALVTIVGIVLANFMGGSDKKPSPIVLVKNGKYITTAVEVYNQSRMLVGSLKKDGWYEVVGRYAEEPTLKSKKRHHKCMVMFVNTNGSSLRTYECGRAGEPESYETGSRSIDTKGEQLVAKALNNYHTRRDVP